MPAATRSPTAHTTVDRAADGAAHRRLGLHRFERDQRRRPARPVARARPGPAPRCRAAAPRRRTRRRGGRQRRDRPTAPARSGSACRVNSPGGLPSRALLGERAPAARCGRRAMSAAWAASERAVLGRREGAVLDARLEPPGARRPAARAARRRRPGTSGCGRRSAAATVPALEVPVRARTCSTPARCGRRTDSRPGPPCRRCTGRRRRCRPRSRASTCAPGCTSW